MSVTKSITSFFEQPRAQQTRIIARFVVIISILALGFAYVAQYGFGMQPCILCLYQRWPYRIAIILGVLALMMTQRKLPSARLAIWAVVPTYITGAAIALFQVGVEQHWWQGTEECTGSRMNGLSADQFLQAIQNAPSVRCDEIQFEFLGISMAGYNGLLSLGLAIVLLVVLVRTQFKTRSS